MILETEDPNQVEIVSKDVLSRHNGRDIHVFPGKDVIVNFTAGNLFELLEAKGIETHFIKILEENSFLAWKLDMIPIEVVCRRVFTGSALKRNKSLKEGLVSEKIIFEMFFKDDKNDDPIMIWDSETGRFDLHYPYEPSSGENFIDNIPLSQFELTVKDLDKIRETAIRVFEILENAWSEAGIILVDQKIEFGITTDGRIVVGDVIDGDSCRLWRAKNKEIIISLNDIISGKSSKQLIITEEDIENALDKDYYRKAEEVTPEVIAKVTDDYSQLQEITAGFVAAL